ncbi:MAG TPA: helix-turn-helix domain-containing protein [Dokdonella sp.]
MGWITSATSPHTHALYFKVLPPAAALRPWVRYYWILKDDTSSPQIDEYLAPDGFEEFIFSYAGGFRRQEICGPDSHEQVLDRSYAVGAKSAGVTCARLGRLAMIGVKLWPGALHALLHMPLHVLAGKPLRMADLDAPILSELEHRLFDADGEAAVARILDEGLMRALPVAPHAMLGHAIGELFASRGTLGIDDITSRYGVHYRTLEKAFRERIGIPPKALAKVLRFKHAFGVLSGDAAARGMGAADFGYYDQSHFCKEFKHFTGRSPTRFFRERLSVDVAAFCLGLDLRAANGSPLASGIDLRHGARHARSGAAAQFLQDPRRPLP